jgi:hypothetical protein
MATSSVPERRSQVGDAILRLLRQDWGDLTRVEALLATSATVPNDTIREEARRQVVAARELLEGVGELLRQEAR